MEACQSSYLNPQPVPPRTIAASRIAPATEPIMILVPLGPVGVKESASEGTKIKKKQVKVLSAKNLDLFFRCWISVDCKASQSDLCNNRCSVLFNTFSANMEKDHYSQV